ncbi:hypothetical protein FRC04_000069 [Tulasnella sp. 424]|nr:hypothetical protein FRC04_000069 [Tulasnella sp. 424]KAG8981931.1 hypothetical protein FRC05_000073 [Tulasnella sp. 425]
MSLTVNFAPADAELPDPYDEASTSGKFQVDRCFKDPVWDLIEFDPLVCQIIDTHIVVRNAGTHPGTGHLAQRLVEHIRDRQPELGIDDRDVLCVTVAGLCHDLGHGPFSHVFDNHFIPDAKGKRPDGTSWCHEEASEMMLDALVKDNNIDLTQDRVNFIKDLIRGETRLSINEKKFLFEIVANKRNGIDVDKWDYIARDTRAVGETCTLVASRLIHAARVVDDTICYDHKDSQSVYELFYSRYSLHKRVYNHKTAKAIEYMIVEALLEAEPVFRLAEAIEDPQKYLHVTDSIIEDIERRDDPRLARSKQIIRALRLRQVPKRAEEKCLPTEYKTLWKTLLTPHAIAEMSVKLWREKQARNQPALLGGLDTVAEETDLSENVARDTLQEDVGTALLPAFDMSTNGSSSPTVLGMAMEDEPLTEDDVIVDWSVLHYGMKEKDPLENVNFWSKTHPNMKQQSRPDTSGVLRPERFQEVILRCYAKDKRRVCQVQEAFRAVLSTLPQPEGAEEIDEATPVSTQESEAAMVTGGGSMKSDHHPRTPTMDQFQSIPGVESTTVSPAVSNSNTSPTARPTSRHGARSTSRTPFARDPNPFTSAKPTPRQPSGSKKRARVADGEEGSPDRKKRAT